jgi:hypothetical protein
MYKQIVDFDVVRLHVYTPITDGYIVHPTDDLVCRGEWGKFRKRGEFARGIVFLVIATFGLPGAKAVVKTSASS